MGAAMTEQDSSEPKTMPKMEWKADTEDLS